MNKEAYFNRFTLTLPDECVIDCSRPGMDADVPVADWEPKIVFPPEATPDAIRAELKEYGAWDEEELADDAQNRRRIVWSAACNIRDEENENFN